MLFDFLGKYTNRFTIEEMSDDLPFWLYFSETLLKRSGE
jgi:hypothetical protein